MARFEKTVLRAVIFIAGLLLIAGCAVAEIPKHQNISLADYINAVSEPGPSEESPINHTLWIPPVEIACRPKGSFSLNEAFAGRFSKEFQEGAVLFFKQKGRFADVSATSGDLGLMMKVVNYEGGVGNPPRLSMRVEMKLYYLPTKTAILEGFNESFFKECSGGLNRPVRVPLKGKEWILKEGTVRMAELCLRVFTRVDEQLMENKELFLKNIKGVGG